MNNKCEICGIEFKRYQKETPKYCSRECYHESQKVQPREFVCQYCGKSFTRKGFAHNVNQKYCSKDCFYNGRTKSRVMTCQCCGKECESGYRIRTSGKQFCSTSCANSARQKYHDAETLKNDIENLILNHGSYMTRPEICDSLSVSTETLEKYGVSVLDVNEKFGFKSHGKMKGSSVFERRIGEVLSKCFSKVEHHVKYSTCLSPNGYKLEFDFRINDSVLVEADGNQHKKGSPLYSSYMAQCDEIKNQWCKQNDIPLVRIPYRIVVKERYVLNHLVGIPTNHNAVVNDKRDGSKNCEAMDNQQPSQSNVIQFVDWKVQRLMGEDSQTNNPDKSSRRFNEAMI